MKQIITINQLAWGNTPNLDIIDLVVYDFIKSYIFYGNTESITLDKTFYLIDTHTIVEELPILKLSVRGVNSRVENLVSEGYLELANKTNKGYYLRCGKQAELYEGTSFSFLSTSFSIFLEDKKKENKEDKKKEYKERKKEENKERSPFDSPTFLEWWNYLAKEPLWKNKSSRAWEMASKKLKAMGEKKALIAIKIAIDRGYRGVFEPSERDIEEYKEKKDNTITINSII